MVDGSQTIADWKPAVRVHWGLFGRHWELLGLGGGRVEGDEG